MLNEFAKRRPDFRGGLPILLADDRPWAMPGPRETSPGEVGDDRRARLVRMVAESENRADRLLGEMALAIHLLAVNYDLRPDDYRQLLEVDRADPRFERMIDDFHAIYLRHAEALEPVPVPLAEARRPLTRRIVSMFTRPGRAVGAPRSGRRAAC
jgi:hypothetical protein